MITIKQLRTGQWESIVQVGGLVPMTETFVSQEVARDWANKTDRELRAVRAKLLTIALGNRGKPKSCKERPPKDVLGLITPAIERFLKVYGCAGELPLEQRAPRPPWLN